MWPERSNRSMKNVRSTIVNCLCPECGGAIELCSNQMRKTMWQRLVRDRGERTFERHLNTARRQSSTISQEPAMAACTRTEDLGIPVAFKMVSKPHTSNAIVDTRKPRSAGSDAANDGGCHGQSDRILHSGSFLKQSQHGPGRTWQSD